MIGNLCQKNPKIDIVFFVCFRVGPLPSILSSSNGVDVHLYTSIYLYLTNSITKRKLIQCTPSGSRASSNWEPLYNSRPPPHLNHNHHDTLTVHYTWLVRIPLIAHYILCVLISGYEIITRLLAGRHARILWAGHRAGSSIGRALIWIMRDCRIIPDSPLCRSMNFLNWLSVKIVSIQISARKYT